MIAAGRNERVLAKLRTMGADATIQLDQSDDALKEEFARAAGDEGFDVIIDYLWGRPTEVLLGGDYEIGIRARDEANAIGASGRKRRADDFFAGSGVAQHAFDDIGHGGNSCDARADGRDAASVNERRERRVADRNGFRADWRKLSRRGSERKVRGEGLCWFRETVEIPKFKRRTSRERIKMTPPIIQSIKLPASPEELYRTIINSKLHTAMTGMPAKISDKVGAEWSAFGGSISGRNLMLVPGKDDRAGVAVNLFQED